MPSDFPVTFRPENRHISFIIQIEKIIYIDINILYI